jgi:hypothetical protein
MRRGTSQPESCNIKLCSVKLQLNTSIPGLEPAAEPNLSTLLKVYFVEPIRFYPCI